MAKNNNTFWIVFLIVVIALFLFVMPFGSRGGFCGMMGSYYGANYGYGMMSGGFGGIFMLVVLIALILLIVWLVRQLQNPRTKSR